MADHRMTCIARAGVRVPHINQAQSVYPESTQTNAHTQPVQPLISYWHHTVVCLSVRLSVCPCVMIRYCGVQGRCKGWHLYRRVPGRGLPIHFFRDFCCTMYRLATTGEKSDGYQKQFETVSLISEHSCWPRLFKTTVCSYTVRRTQYDRLSPGAPEAVWQVWRPPYQSKIWYGDAIPIKSTSDELFL